MEKLSRKQQRALDLIIEKIRAQGYPPTLQELTEALGAASRNTAVKYLKILARKGHIIWEHNKARGIQLLERGRGADGLEEIGLPLIGTVTAGTPMLAEQNIERHVQVPRYLLRSSGAHFLLRVRGDSMIQAGILPDDLVVVRSQADAQTGDVVVALLDGEATVKRLAVRQGQRFLKAENPAFPDIHPRDDWSIQGKVVALIREEVG
ncbi:transcriptional repressor LexA [candidate division KSB1 bacterium]|nr:transcriptional repressor LexA [candidate division KSB1 bacterium]